MVKKMIKSAKCSIRFANEKKTKELSLFLAEYRKALSFFIDVLWELKDVKSFVSKEISSGLKTWLSARAIQCAGKQASGIVKGTRKKQEQRLFIINRLNKGGKLKQARKLQRIYDKEKVSRPKISNCPAELDERFVSMDFAPATKSFDCWLVLGSLGNKLKIALPIKRHKHFNKLGICGILKRGVRLSDSMVTFMFETLANPPKQEGKTIGIDVGQISILSASDGQQINGDKHGHTYESICEKMSRKKRGSKGFVKVNKHRCNFIHWAVNKLDLNGIKTVRMENIKNLRKGKRCSRKLAHWNYAELFDGLENHLIDSGVQIEKVDPVYTSQRCSCCGWTRKRNRKGKAFICEKCGNTLDSDLNASINLSLDLIPIGFQERLKRPNKDGFYWYVKSRELIVPDVQETFVENIQH